MCGLKNDFKAKFQEMDVKMVKKMVVLGKEMECSGTLVMKRNFEIPDWAKNNPRALRTMASHVAEGYKPCSRERW